MSEEIRAAALRLLARVELHRSCGRSCAFNDYADDIEDVARALLAVGDAGAEVERLMERLESITVLWHDTVHGGAGDLNDAGFRACPQWSCRQTRDALAERDR